MLKMATCCATLTELPPPPPGRTGWPWTEETTQFPGTMPDGSPWPRFSVVTPSYNQGQFIEETIRSVLLQGYPNLEHIVIDGGSSDQSVKIIKKYEPWLTYWVSEKDRGQSHAINKGMARATGEIVAWLNSDDLYLPLTLSRVANAWETGKTHWLVGKIIVGKSLGSPETRTLLSSSRSFLEIAAFWLVRERNLQTLIQPEVFVSRQAWQAVDGVFEKLHLAMDYHLWTKMVAMGYVPTILPEEIAFFRIHSNQKTGPATRDWPLKVMAERVWGLYDALRLARKVKSQSPDIDEIASLLERKAGGYSRILDASYRSRSWFKLLEVALLNAIFRPNTTLRWTPRNVIKHHILSKFGNF